MADEETDGPGVPAVTWVTLGLLAFSWVIVQYFYADDLFEKPSGALDISAAFWSAAVGGPLGLSALAAWVGRHHRVVRTLTFVAGLMYAGLTGAFAANNHCDTPPRIAFDLIVFGGLAWFSGWPCGACLVVAAVNEARNQGATSEDG